MSYVETHGTGTRLGDAVEVGALEAVYSGRETPLILGALKTNTGHTESTAGVAGVLKALLCFGNRQVPPNLHLHTTNPQLPLRPYMILPSALQAWDPPPGQPRLAQVSSFSLTGSNAGLMLEEPRPAAPAVRATQYRAPLPHCLLLSASDPAGLPNTARQALAAVRAHADALPDLCRTLQDCRAHRRLRTAVLGRDAAQIVQRLQQIADGAAAPQLCCPRAASKTPKVAFVLPDEPDLYTGAGRQLYDHVPAFREAVDSCAAVMQPLLDVPLLDTWLTAQPPAPGAVHALQFLLQYALCSMWQSWGVQPSAVLGRGVGEYVAAAVAGLLPLAEAARLCVGMAALFQELAESHCSIRLGHRPASDTLGPHAALTSDEAVDVCVVSVAYDDVSDHRAQASFADHLPLTPGLHSAAMDAVWPRVQALTAGIDWTGRARTPFAWAHSGKVEAAGPPGAAQWVEGWRTPSRWRECLEALAAEGASTVVVMGLHSLRGRVPEGLAVAPGLDPIQKDLQRVALALAVCHTGGIAVPWGEVYGADFRKVRVPGGAFCHVPCQLQYTSTEQRGTGPKEGRPGTAAMAGPAKPTPPPPPSSAAPVASRPQVGSGGAGAVPGLPPPPSLTVLSVLSTTSDGMGGQTRAPQPHAPPPSASIGVAPPTLTPLPLPPPSAVVLAPVASAPLPPSSAPRVLPADVEVKLMEIAADVLQLPPSQIDPSLALATYDMDSLMALELRQQLSREFGVALPATVMYDYPSLRALAPFIMSEMAESQMPEAAAPAVALSGALAPAPPAPFNPAPPPPAAPSFPSPDLLSASTPTASSGPDIEARMTEIAADVLQLPPSQIDSSLALATYDMDSLMALELRQQLSREFGVALPATVMYDYPSLEALAPFIMSEMTESQMPETGAPAVAPPAIPIPAPSPAANQEAAMMPPISSTIPIIPVAGVEAKLVEIAADVLQLPPSQIDKGQALATYDMDSLMALELRQQLSREFGVVLPATVMYDYPSLEALAPFIMSEMAESQMPEAAAPAPVAVMPPVPAHSVGSVAQTPQPQSAPPAAASGVGSDGIQSAASIYDEMLTGADGSGGADREDTLLRFGPFPFVMPGFSWMKTYTDGQGLELSRWAQLELRATAFRYHDLRTSARVLDFGCGMGTDIMELAQLYPHLKLDGYTISPEQAQYGQRKVAERGLSGQVTIYNRDSTKDEFPHVYDMAFAFEVVHHILDKDTLFAHLSRHIREGGHICFADFISHDMNTIDHKESSSFFIRAQDWVELYSKHGFRVDDVVDISKRVASYLYDPDFEAILAMQKTEASKASLVSYDRLGRMLFKGLSSYVLLSATRDSRSTQQQLYAHNKKQLESLVDYTLLPHKPQNIMYQLKWMPQSSTALAQPQQSGARVLLVGPVGPASPVVLQLKVLLQEHFQVFHVIHTGQDSVQVGAGNVIAMNCNEQEHWSQVKSQVSDISVVIDAQGWKESSDVGPTLHRVHATVRGVLSKFQQCSRYIVLSEDATMACMVEGFAKSLGAEVPRVQTGALRTQEGTQMHRVVEEIRCMVSGDREAAVWLQRDGQRLVRRLEPHPLCMKLPVQLFTPGAGSYLITGGTGGIGLAVARFLAARGAQCVVLTSRRAPGPGSQVHLLQQQYPQTRFVVEQVDVANVEKMKKLVDRLAVPLVGIMHCAGVMHNIAVRQMASDELDSMLAAKVTGTLALHELSLHVKQGLQSFVLFSSIASALGNPMQCGYAAANGFMDGFAEWRRQQGLPCLSMQWGAWAEAGMASDELTSKHLRDVGIIPMTTEQALSGLEWALCHKTSLGATVMAALVDWVKVLRGYARMEAVPPLLETTARRVIDKIYQEERALKLEAAHKRRAAPPAVASAPAAVSVAQGTVQQRPRDTPSISNADVEAKLVEIAADVLQLPPSQIDKGQALATYDMDSLMALELRQQLSREFGVVLPATVMYDYPSLEALAPFIMSEMAESQMPEAAAPAPVAVMPPVPAHSVGSVAQAPQPQSAPPAAASGVGSDGIQSAASIYDEMLTGADGSGGADREDTLLRFGPFPFVMPGFSWMKTYTDGQGLELSRWAQLELRATAFRYHDLRTSARVLDFGCGMGTDIMELAQLYPHLKLDGYTISPEQAQYGQRKVAERGLSGQVTIYNRDSTKDEFPHVYDMAFAFEVVHHILDKDTLFAHLSRHIREGGHICFADFISHDMNTIDHKESSSFFIRAQDWVELYSKHGFRVDDVVDISKRVASYLYDPDFEAILAMQKTEASKASLVSYDRLGRMLFKGLSSYVLLSATRDSRSTQQQLYAHNKKQLESLVDYTLLPHKPQNIMYQLKWMPQSSTALAQPQQSGARVLLVGPVGPASPVVLQLKVLLQEHFQVFHVIHTGQDSVQVGAGNVIAMNCNEQEHWSQVKSQVSDISVVIDAQGWKESSDVGPTLHRVHATVRGVLSKFQQCSRYIVLSEDATMACMVEGFAKSLGAEVPRVQTGALRTQEGTQMHRVVEEIRCMVSGDREAAVWLQRDGQRLVRRLEPHPLCMKLPVQLFTPGAGSYLITGGTGGIGLAVARFLAARGAQCVVLTSRRAPGPGSQVHLLQQQYPQTRFVVEQVDVANVEKMKKLVDRLAVPLVGIMHCAGVMHNIAVRQMTSDELDSMLAAKVTGTLALHELSLTFGVGSFVLFSSIASALGNPMQCGYAAANGFMDGFAEWRRQQGLPCLSMQWGAWAEAGMASDELTSKHLRDVGIIPMTTEQALSGLEWALCHKTSLGATVMAALVDWVKVLRGYARMEAVPPLLETTARRVIDKIYQEERTLKLEAAHKRRAAPPAVASPRTPVHTAPVSPPSAAAPVSEPIGPISVSPSRAPISTPPSVPAVGVVGAALKLPGASTLQEFWDNMMQGKDSMMPVPPERWDNASWYDPRPAIPGKLYTRAAGFVDGIGEFDPGFFSLSESEARFLDPQQRMLLEVTWEALEDAVIVPQSLYGSSTSVYIGVSNPDYSLRCGSIPIGPYVSTGNAFSCVSGRISYTFRLQGPALSVDTACSASAVCTQLALESLRGRKSSLALAAGVNAMLEPSTTIALCQVTALSPNNRTASFGAEADGYSRGEGAAMAVLQRVEDVQAHQRLYGIVQEAAVAQDGYSQGLTAPNGPAQQALMRGSLADAGLTADDIGYVEMHATGTALGDPIEMESVRRVYGGRARGTAVAVSCGKTNIGHLESAAGLAGLLRCLLVTSRQTVPPLLHVTALNPHFPDLARARVHVPVAGAQLPASLRYSALNSFGFSGTLANIILSPPPATAPSPLPQGQPLCPILALSAKTPEALRLQARRWAAALPPTLQELQTFAGAHLRHRTAFAHRLAIPCTAAAAAALSDFADSAPHAPLPAALSLGHAPERPRTVALIFGGLRPIPPALGRALCNAYPAFRELVHACEGHVRGLLPDAALRQYLGVDPASISPASAPEVDSVVGHVGHFVLGYGLASLLTTAGLRPSVVFGSGQGEFIAACVAGLLPLPDALQLVARRAALLHAQAPRTASVLVRCAPAQAQEAIAACAAGREVAVSSVLSPNTVVLSGAESALARVRGRLPGRSLAVNLLLPYHTGQLQGYADAVQRLAAAVPWGTGTVPVVSGIRGAVVDPKALCSAQYWADHLWQPLDVAAGLGAVAERADVVVELGASPQLRPLLQPHACRGLWALEAPGPGQWSLAPLLARLFTLGARLDWRAVSGPSPGHTATPFYAFHRQPLLHPPTKPPGAPASGRPALLYSVEWEPAAGPEVDAAALEAEPQRWLVVTERPVPFAAPALVRLGSDGGPAGDAAEDWEALVRQHRGSAPGVVYVAGGGGAGAAPAAAAATLQRLVLLLQAAQGTGWTVVVVTTGAQPAHPSPCLAQAPLPALVRSAGPECPGLRVVAVDVPALEPDLLRRIAAVRDWGPEDEQYWGPQGVQAPRLVPSAPSPAPATAWHPQRWYVLTGALGGVGTATALAMARAGARAFAFVSRSGAPPRAEWEASPDALPALRHLLALEALGARVRVDRCDVTDRAAVRELLLELEADGGVEGVLHLAGVPGISELTSLTPTDCMKALQPKIFGAHCLHELTQELCPALSCFTLYSSTASIFGGRMQTLYAASNRYLDALGLLRARLGLPATVINWGMWAASAESTGSADFIKPALKV